MGSKLQTSKCGKYVGDIDYVMIFIVLCVSGFALVMKGLMLLRD